MIDQIDQIEMPVEESKVEIEAPKEEAPKHRSVGTFEIETPEISQQPEFRGFDVPEEKPATADVSGGEQKEPPYEYPKQTEIKGGRILAIGGISLNWEEADDYDFLRLQANQLFMKLSEGTVHDVFREKSGRILWDEKHPLISQFMQGMCPICWHYSRRATGATIAVDAAFALFAGFFGYRAGAEIRKQKKLEAQNADPLDNSEPAEPIEQPEKKKRKRKKQAETSVNTSL